MLDANVPAWLSGWCETDSFWTSSCIHNSASCRISHNSVKLRSDTAMTQSGDALATNCARVMCYTHTHTCLHARTSPCAPFSANRLLAE